jgi:hypothetical protein
MYLGSVPLAQEPRTWSGVLSESVCGASHQATAGPAGMSDRECVFHCLKGLAKVVIVDGDQNVIPIANQDFAGIPLRLARPVRVTGEPTDRGIIVSRIELPPVHAHIGHVMTAWRDTPGQVGLLTIAQSDMRVATAHALLLAKAGTLDDMKVHAGHVLHALDPALEAVGPASGYGAKKAAAGAMQHAGFAAAVDNASPAVKSHANRTIAALTAAVTAMDRGIAAAQGIRSSGAASADAGARVMELQSALEDVTRALQQSEGEMRVMMKAEGL